MKKSLFRRNEEVYVSKEIKENALDSHQRANHARLFTVPYFFVRSFRYTASSYRNGYLDFKMYRGGGRRGLTLMQDG